MMVLVFNPIILGGRSRQISVNWSSAQREREREVNKYFILPTFSRKHL